MNILKLLSGKNMGVLMGILTGGNVDMAKLMPIIGEMLTEENIKQAVVEIHKGYVQQLEKLPEGHSLKVVLEPDPERGLKLVFWDFAPDGTATKAYDDIYLAEVTPQQLQGLLNSLFAAQDEQQPAMSEPGQQLSIAAPVSPLGGQGERVGNDDDTDKEIEDFEAQKNISDGQ